MKSRIHCLLLAIAIFAIPQNLISCTQETSCPPQIAVPKDSALLQRAIEACLTSTNRGKSVGIFGGSLSCLPESESDKTQWKMHLAMDITTYGKGGYGFSSLQGSIQDQVNHATPKDIYILWASTNDFTNNRPAGKPTDYTQEDGFPPTKRVTQCGGINYCIKRLKEINPNCKIFIFGSLPYFENDGGYNECSKYVNETGHNFYHYVQQQEACAEYHHVLFLDQFHIPILTPQNINLYYQADRVHMTAQGYAELSPYHLYFLATEKEIQPIK